MGNAGEQIVLDLSKRGITVSFSSGIAMNRKDHTTDAVIAGDRESKSKSELLRISSGTLLNGRTELIIEHAGEEYRLRITSKGKLILTK